VRDLNSRSAVVFRQAVRLGMVSGIRLAVSPRLLFVCMFGLLLGASEVRAQGPIPKGDAYFGYSRTGNDAFYPGVGGLNGWEAALFVKIHKPFLGVEADVSHYGLGANSAIPRTTAVMAGPRVGVKIPLVRSCLRMRWVVWSIRRTVVGRRLSRTMRVLERWAGESIFRFCRSSPGGWRVTL
jgi:hypothetical protein